MQRAVRLKPPELTAVFEIQLKVLTLLHLLLHEFYFKCFFKCLGSVLVLASPTDHKPTDFLYSPVPPHRVVGGILYILPISMALYYAAAWIAFVYSLVIAIKEIKSNKRKQRYPIILLNFNLIVHGFFISSKKDIFWCHSLVWSFRLSYFLSPIKGE